MNNHRNVVFTPEIRFADIDAMGHVNNAVYLSYFEQARIHYFRELIGAEWDWKEHGILLARNEIDYKIPILLHDVIDILVWCGDAGNKSFTMNYSVVNRATAAEVCTGKSILVAFNYLTQESVRVPDSWREAFVDS